MRSPYGILVAGGRAGLGATTVAALLALLAAAERRRVMLVTGDEKLRISEANLTVLPLEGLPHLSGDYDLVIIDSGSTRAMVEAACATGIDSFVCLTTGDRVTAAAAHALIKAVEAASPGLRMNVLVNHMNEPAASAQFEELASASQRFLSRSLSYAGSVPEDECLRAGIAGGMEMLDAASGSPATAAIHRIGTRLLKEVSPAASEPHSFQRRS